MNERAPSHPRPPSRADFRRFVPIPTRWHDNDVYGHVNNVVYYAWFDTAVNRTLIEEGVLDPAASTAFGIVVETGCRYFAPLAFPDPVEVGMAVEEVGTSSVRWRIGVFRADIDKAAAAGHFVHVYVDRATQRPVPIPDDARALFARLAAP